MQSTTNSTNSTSSSLQSSISNDEAKRSDLPLNHKSDEGIYHFSLCILVLRANFDRIQIFLHFQTSHLFFSVMNSIGNVLQSAATPSPPSKRSRISQSSNKENGGKVSRKHASISGMFMISEVKIKISLSGEEKHKRSKNWTDEDTKLFIEIWNEHSEQLRAGGARNIPIYNNMAQQIKELTASDRLMTSSEVKTKIFNLVAEYRKRKNDQGKSGGSPSSWRFFDRIDEIIGESLFFSNDNPLVKLSSFFIRFTTVQ